MRQSFLKPAVTTHTMVVDGGTGEILDQDIKQLKFLANSKEQFYIIYTSLIGVFQQMGAPEIKLYSYLLQNYPVGTEIALPKGMKDLIAKKIKLKSGTVNNALSELLKKKLLYITQRAIYKINPRYAFKGSTKDRNALLKVVLEFECPDC